METEFDGQLLEKVALEGRVDHIGNHMECLPGTPPQELIHHPRLQLGWHGIKALQH
jgi:hypothetical protein